LVYIRSILYLCTIKLKQILIKMKKEQNSQPLNISEVMQRALEAYKYIEEYGTILSQICEEKIQPLIDAKKYDEAKQVIRDFYKPSRYNRGGEYEGDVIFIEYDMLFARINRLIRENNV
jgi:hypothetical protein